MDKFVETALSSYREQLGLDIDTRSLTISMPLGKRKKLSKLLSQFGPHKRKHYLKAIAELTGTLNYLGFCSTWYKFCYIRIQESLIKSYLFIHKLKNNPKYAHIFQSNIATSSPGFVHRIPHLLVDKAALIWKTRSKVLLSPSAIQQIQDIQTILNEPDKYEWSRPINR